tara:strand:+ start:3053 stop:3853 length:801 start_codon:yes stop_codon:yes gene_type:complete
MKNQKILVASPTYKGMQYCQEQFLERITNLDYDNYDVLIVDNSKDDSNFNILKQNKKIKVINVIRDSSDEKNKMLKLINSRNLILNYAIKNNYDYILMMDSDVIPLKNILQELLKSNKDIVSGLYYNYFISDGKTKYLPVAWTELTNEEFNEIKQKIKLPDFVKSKEDLRARLTEQEAQSNKLIQVAIPSAGCMLISRNVFSKIKYEMINTNEMNNIKTTDDVGFILQAKKQGFKIYCNTKIKCEHLIKGKFRKNEQGINYHPIYE